MDAISTYKVFLMIDKLGDGTYEKVIDIKDFPDLGGTPEMLEKTTLSDRMQTYIPGIQSMEALEFNTNYNLEEYKKLKELEGKEYDYAVWFGGTETATDVTPTGSDGKYNFKGELSAFPTGGGVNEVVGTTISIAPSTPIVLATA